MPKADSNIPLPPARCRHSPEAHMRMSRRFIAHARNELAKDNRLQASEKIWGASAHALTSIAVQRGWKHRNHDLMYVIASQLSAEQGRPDLAQRFKVAESHHRNFYRNDQFPDDIKTAIDNVEGLVQDLDAVRRAGGGHYKVDNSTDQDRLEELTGRRYSIGAESSNGFTNPKWSWKYGSSRSRNSGNGGGNTPTAQPKTNGPSTATGGQANQTPGSAPDVQLRPGKTLNQSDADAGNAGRSGNSGRRNRRNRRNNRKNRGGESPEVNIRLD